MQALQRGNRDEVRIRRTKVRELIGCGYTVMQMHEAINDYLEANDLHPIAVRTLGDDLAVIRKDFQDAVSEDTHIRAQEHAARLMYLEQRMNEDYESARERGKNPALLADNLRKVIMDRAKLDGSLVEKHQHDGNLTILQKIQAVLEVKPQVEPDVIPLLEDGEFALLPNPTRHSDG